MSEQAQTQSAIPREASVAAKWWADRLRFGSKQQASAASTRETDAIEIAIAVAAETARRLTDQQIDDFERILATAISSAYIVGNATWEKAKADPMWGSANRMLLVDYGACDMLRAAYQAAGGSIHMAGVFPIKTTMWINPGSVEVSYGYCAPREELMAALKAKISPPKAKETPPKPVSEGDGDGTHSAGGRSQLEHATRLRDRVSDWLFLAAWRHDNAPWPPIAGSSDKISDKI